MNLSILVSKKILIFILFLFSLSFSQYENEQLIYEVEIKELSFFTGTIGQCIINFNSINNNEYKMEIITQTTNFAKRLFPYFDSIEMLLDTNLSLLEMEHLIISKKTIERKTKIDKIKKNISFNNNKLSFYKDTLFTPYSLIYYLRNKLTDQNNKYEYKIYDSGKLKDIKLTVNKAEEIKVPYGTVECINLIPIENEKLIKNKGKLEIWYSNDNKKIPIQIKLKSKFGTFIMKLKEINKK